MNEHFKHIETRTVLAVYWSFVSSLLLGYILVKYGGEKEILTLIIGLIGGTVLGGIFGVYFGSTVNKKEPTSSTEISITKTDKSVEETKTD